MCGLAGHHWPFDSRETRGRLCGHHSVQLVLRLPCYRKSIGRRLEDGTYDRQVGFLACSQSMYRGT
jgi:hypothetical protein